jgi:BirA family biotin operon repressor/biotin-[acetyl-CoA-carboxylase] ligase
MLKSPRMKAATESGTAAAASSAFAQPLARDLIERALAAGREAIEVEAVRETGSTNSDLLALARARQPQRPRLRAALVQSAGRGRHGRRWHSSPGASLLFSLAVPLADSPHALASITLACGVAIAETLNEDGVAVQLKWPNDVLLDGRKLAGILCELAQDGAGRRTLVIGVGVNLWADAAMRASAAQPLATLAERIAPAQLAAGREARIARLARALLEVAREYERDGFVPLQPRYMRWFAHTDAEVDIVDHGTRVVRGRALGVDGEGRLLLQTDAGLRAFASGELSLRPAGATP